MYSRHSQIELKIDVISISKSRKWRLTFVTWLNSLIKGVYKFVALNFIPKKILCLSLRIGLNSVTMLSQFGSVLYKIPWLNNCSSTNVIKFELTQCICRGRFDCFDKGRRLLRRLRTGWWRMPSLWLYYAHL